MRKRFKPVNNEMKWVGIVSIVLCLIEPWLIVVNLTIGMWLVGTGMIGVGTYIERLPFYQKNIGYRLCGMLLFILIAFINTIYIIVILLLLQFQG
ncbi:hypothetical protein ACE83Q_00010 [Dellaglioa sp. P0083]|uniref:hypothetical protein n=1 Tax=Dellaglioa kimchii TaxID=3344667 RepID=UPI0038D4E252